MDSSEVVFEGDDFTRGQTRGGESTLVAKSSVTDFLLRKHIVRSERQARWVAGSIAALSIALTVMSANWATRALGAPPAGKPFAEMTVAERAELPPKHRLYLEKLERAAAEAKEAEIRNRFRNTENQ